MSTHARRRIISDIMRLSSDPPHGVAAAPFDNNIMFFHAVIAGPEETLWETASFHMLIHFSEEYPSEPPDVRFLSRMFHPNIYIDGKICLDILQNQWSAMYDISAVLTSIQSLLNDPNPNSPANPEAARIFTEDKTAYSMHVLKCVEDSWDVPAKTAEQLLSS
eukprot:GHVS01042727.1.p1 GENE.GHVS01042727.1~~GHVS01042727.1.p1  ORF type:complete len:163 (-),score=23.46 GHVS01042727.1:188-676(-)